MAKKRNHKEQEPSLLHNLLCYIFGILFISLPPLIYIALLSYHNEDPSFNKATSGEAQNILGLFGSYSADFVLSTFGLSFIIFLIALLFWGYDLLRYRTFVACKSRIFAWFIGLISLACFLDLTCRPYLSNFNFPYNLTGEWSRIISRPFNTYVNMINIPYNAFILEGIILFVSILAFNFSAGITFKLWIRVCHGLFSTCRKAANAILRIGKKAANIRDYREFKEINPRYLQNKYYHRSAENYHNEPEFSADTDNFTQNLHTSSSLSSISEPPHFDFAPTTGPDIEIPQTLDTPSFANQNKFDTTRKTSFNPAFEFMNDENLDNSGNHKNTAKLAPEDIYQTEKSKPTRKNKASAALQTELLEVSSKQPSDAEYSLHSQLAGNATPRSKPAKSADNSYILPDINLLSLPKSSGTIVIDENVLKQNAAQLEQVLNDFGIRGKIVKVRPGPVVTLYELEPAPGTRTARVIGLSDDIARSMSVTSVRMAVVSGHNTIGIELPNAQRQTVWLRELLQDNEFQVSKNILNVALGKDIGGQHVYADLSKMPHLLVAGTTGSGKSVGVNSMILSLLYRMTPEQCKFIMIDPKQLEFSMYNGIPHLLTPVITDPTKAVVGLKWAVQEMESRYRSMALLNVRNIAGYNKKVEEMNKAGKEIKKTIQTGFDKETGLPIYEEQILDTSPMPYIVIVVDEMADLMLVAGKEVEAAIQRLAQMARAAGIHLIMSTQRPSVDVITGVIKANFPSRISFHVTTKFDSSTILGEKGAEQLLGMGDMLYMPSGMRPIRVHGCFVPDEEVEKIVEFIKSQGEPKYVAEVTAGELNTKDSGPVFDKGEISGDGEEDLYQEAVSIVRTDKKASTSYIQRKLRIGYNRAANLIERMEREGVISRPDHVGRREVIGA